MDTQTKKVHKVAIHKHPLYFSVGFIKAKCNGCHVEGTMYGGYHCNEYGCAVWFHKECGEAPHDMNHQFHPEHPLLLNNEPRDGSCDCCGKELLAPCYICYTCEFKVDLICGMMKLSLPTIQHPVCHDHPLVFLKKRDEEEESSCEVCNKSIVGPLYTCIECNNVYFHVGCVQLSKEVSHPCHSNHLLKLTAYETLPNDAENGCYFCGRQQAKIYHCSMCNFTSCLGCTKNPPPIVIEHTKTHKHPLTLFSNRISFTCKVCGIHGVDMKLYICLECDFCIHGDCIDLPQIININRHDHCLSFNQHLGVGYSKCGVCRQSLSQYHGAYSCSICSNYAVHSKCAVRRDIWDGVELDEIKNDEEYIAPFKVVGNDLISHFSHDQHHLKLVKDYVLYDKWLQCEACIYPIGFEPMYVCDECNIFLHEKCANLPMKKRVIFDTVPYTLDAMTGYTSCKLCRLLSGGFKYMWNDKFHDVHCSSLSDPFVHDGHSHPLYFDKIQNHYCDGCYDDAIDGYVLRCAECNFDLCFYCASLPKKIWYRLDEHPLTLFYGKNESYNNWCDNCEMELYPCRWFYTCSDCGVNLHARCVFGDFSRLHLGWNIVKDGKAPFQIILNKNNTRPLCIQCHSRCKFSIILKDTHKVNVYICSYPCLLRYDS